MSRLARRGDAAEVLRAARKMGKNLASGKRPTAKLKIMKYLGENIYGTTKIYRYLQAREDHLGLLPKGKWQRFLSNTSEEYNVWRQWWKSPQSARWKNLHNQPPRSSE